jgi:hypothetical protein
MKKLLIVTAALLSAVLFFSACQNPSGGSGEDKGSKPVLKKALWTENDAMSKYNKIEDYPNLNNNIQLSTASEEHKYAFAISFSDKDLNVIALYTSFDKNFGKDNTKKREVSQKFEDQISLWSDITWSGDGSGTEKYYVKLEDAKGNFSNVIEMDMTFKE